MIETAIDTNHSHTITNECNVDNKGLSASTTINRKLLLSMLLLTVMLSKPAQKARFLHEIVRQLGVFCSEFDRFFDRPARPYERSEFSMSVIA